MRPPATARLVALAAAMSAVAAGLAAWSGGFGARVGGPDLYAYFLAKQAYVAETFRAGHLPLWNPYEFCGLPLLGTAQGSALYAPVVLAHMALSATAAMQVLYDLHIAAYILLTLVYLTRRGHGLPPRGARRGGAKPADRGDGRREHPRRLPGAAQARAAPLRHARPVAAREREPLAPGWRGRRLPRPRPRQRRTPAARLARRPPLGAVPDQSALHLALRTVAVLGPPLR